jgi:hypothetical protein
MIDANDEPLATSPHDWSGSGRPGDRPRTALGVLATSVAGGEVDGHVVDGEAIRVAAWLDPAHVEADAPVDLKRTCVAPTRLSRCGRVPRGRSEVPWPDIGTERGLLGGGEVADGEGTLEACTRMTLRCHERTFLYRTMPASDILRR